MTGFVDQARALVGLVYAWRAPGQLSVMTGVRTTAAVLVPLIVGQLANHPAIGLMAGVGGLNVSLADIGGPYQVKAMTMGVAMISMATAALLGTVVGGLSWLALPLVFLLAWVASLAGVFGNAAAKVSFLSLVLFVLMVDLPAGFVDSLERCAAFIGGGLWAMVLSLWLWPLWPYQPIREAVAACYQALSALIDGTCQARTGQGAEASGLAASATPERAAVVAALDQAHGMVVAVRAARAGMSPVGQGLLVQLRRADAMFDAVIALAETLEMASQHPRYAQVRAEVDHAVHQLAVTMAALATAIRQGHDRLDFAALNQAVAAVSDRVLTRPQSWQHPAEDSIESIDLYSIAGALQTVTVRVRAAADTLTQHGELWMGEPPPMAGSQPTGARLRAVVGLLRDNFTFRSLAFRHALRLGVTTMAAVALYTVLDLPHGAWVTLTALVILKPNFGGTYQQAVQRVSGTVAGSVMGAILAAAIIKPLFLDLLLIPLGLLAFAVMASHYGLGVLFLTPFVVVLLNTVQPGDWELAAIRSLDTIIGGLLALLAGYLLWPSWERERLPEQLARTITANLDYFRSVMSGYLGGQGDLAAMHARRAQAQVENTNAAAAFQRLLSEPMIQHGPIAPVYTLVTYNQRFYDGVTTLAVGQSNGNGRHVLPGIDGFTMQVDRALQDLAQAVRNGRRAAALPSFDASLGVARASVRELMTADAAKPATDQSNEFTHGAIHGIAALSSELDRLADEVIEMSKAVERAANPGSNPVKSGALSESGA
jgi:uncharacterized membrane protein YccC